MEDAAVLILVAWGVASALTAGAFARWAKVTRGAEPVRAATLDTACEVPQSPGVTRASAATAR